MSLNETSLSTRDCVLLVLLERGDMPPRDLRTRLKEEGRHVSQAAIYTLLSEPLFVRKLRAGVGLSSAGTARASALRQSLLNLLGGEPAPAALLSGNRRKFQIVDCVFRKARTQRIRYDIDWGGEREPGVLLEEGPKWRVRRGERTLLAHRFRDAAFRAALNDWD